MSLRDFLFGGCPGPVPIDPNLSGVEGFRLQAGLPPLTQTVAQELQHNFPGLRGIGCWGDDAHARAKSCHNAIRDKRTGRVLIGPRACDAMTTDPDLHAAIVAWALKNRARLKITLIISRRRKWSAKTGWMAARYLGRSPHTDHVHLSIDCQG